MYAFTRAGDAAAQAFARELGAAWTGSSEERPPEELDAAIVFAPVGALIPAALRAVRKGGVVVAGGIHMSDIPSFPYRILWGERVVRSVANLTRRDAEEFLALAPKVPVRTETELFPLAEANAALDRLRAGRLRGAAVLVPGRARARSSRSLDAPVAQASFAQPPGARSLGGAACLPGADPAGAERPYHRHRHGRSAEDRRRPRL